MSKHTRTPWIYCGVVDSNHVQKCQLILQAKRTNAINIAKVIPCVGMTAEEVEANANLMAAAPEMRDILEGFVFYIKNGSNDRINQVYEDAKLLLKKINDSGFKAKN